MGAILWVIWKPRLGITIGLRGAIVVERKIHEIRQVGWGRVAAIHFGDVYQFAQDRVFQFELDAVDQCFEGDVDVK